MRTLLGAFHRLHRQTEGAAAIEFALITTGLIFIIIPMIDVGQALINSLRIDSALRAGLQYAISEPDDSAGIQSAVQNGTTIASASITPGITTFCECDGTTQTCGTSCAGTMATYKTISATYNMPLLMDYPGFANPYPISRSVTFRSE